jgi:hypothetical protein
MEVSLFLAKLIGVGLTIIATSMLINRRNIDLLFEAYRTPAALYITGIVEVFLGLAIVLSHNVWVADFRLVITIIGWTLLMRGVGRACMPHRIMRELEKFRAFKAYFTPLLFGILALGIYLAYTAFAY